MCVFVCLCVYLACPITSLYLPTSRTSRSGEAGRGNHGNKYVEHRLDDVTDGHYLRRNGYELSPMASRLLYA